MIFDGIDILTQGERRYLSLEVPSQVGSVTSATIDSKTAASVKLTVTGYSPPRDFGDTEVYLSFVAAPGASIVSTSPFRALKDDIKIWYERTSSYPFGSQCEGSMTVSFTGDVNAIGTARLWLKNYHGDSEPYCLDFKSGSKQACEK